MARILVAVIPFLLLFAAAPASAVDLDGNDAGSGRDAGDVRALALPLTSESTTGRLTQRTDISDWYTFEAAGNSVLVFDLESDCPIHVSARLVDPTGKTHRWFPWSSYAYLAEAGAWALELTLAVGTEDTMCNYDFTSRLREGAHRFDGGQVTEIAWSNATEFIFIDEGESKFDGSAAGRFAGSDVAFTGTSHTTGFASLVRMPGTGAAPLIQVKEQRVESPVSPPAVGTISTASFAGSFGIRSEDITGTMQFFSTGAPDETQFIVWIDVPLLETRTGPLGGRVEWTSYDDDMTVVAPGVSAADGRTLTVALDSTFRGVFDPRGTQGRFAPPDENMRTLDPTHGLFLWFGPTGDWRFELDADTRVGHDAAYHYLSGIFVPSLDLHDSIFD